MAQLFQRVWPLPPLRRVLHLVAESWCRKACTEWLTGMLAQKCTAQTLLLSYFNLVWSNRWPASQIWLAAFFLSEMENNCSNSRCCLNTDISLSPLCRGAGTKWLCPVGTSLNSLTALSLLLWRNRYNAWLFVSREFVYGVERGTWIPGCSALCLRLDCLVTFAR